MNWLAHLYLSEPTPAFRLGNLLPDLLPLSQLQGLPEGLARGAHCHRQIDAYTDAHPVVRRSVGRIAPPLRRFGAVLVDVFYDHLLARAWPHYSTQPLALFEDEIYHAIDHSRALIAEPAYSRLLRMRQHRWLGGNTELESIRATLARIGARLRRPTELASGADLLRTQHEDFAADFAEFFPQLIDHVRQRYAIVPTPPFAQAPLHTIR